MRYRSSRRRTFSRRRPTSRRRIVRGWRAGRRF